MISIRGENELAEIMRLVAKLVDVAASEARRTQIQLKLHQVAHNRIKIPNPGKSAYSEDWLMRF